MYIYILYKLKATVKLVFLDDKQTDIRSNLFQLKKEKNLYYLVIIAL